MKEVRLTADHSIPPAKIPASDEPFSPLVQLWLKEQLNADAEAFGFTVPTDKYGNIADWLLDHDPESVLEVLDVEETYLLTGEHDGWFYYVHIRWELGSQPSVIRVERETIK
jgi:hypothetical protein